ncbi:hypothetical protein ACJMK2_014067 [Sinanodonta woodiana]|uniref:Uncharacterized protein n=1 Tax=Sinanodonta woodiana TaxID=1069815 RepID=A0ABD3UZI3_SINWO
MAIKKKEFGKSSKNTISLKRDMETLKGRLNIMEKDLIPKVSGNNAVGVSDILPNTIQHGSVEVIQILLQGGANINVRSQNGENLLHIACIHNRLDIIKLLYSQNANLVNEIDNDRRSVGHFAAAGGSVEVLKFLVSLGLNPYCKDSTGWNLLHYACFNESLSQHTMNTYPQLLYDRTDEGMSVLLCAAFGGTVSIFKNIYELIYNYIKRDLRENKNGTKYTNNMMETIGQHTLLHMSCLGRRREMTKYLVEMCPEMLNAVDSSNSTPAHEAAYSGSVSILKILIDRGADPWCRTSRKETLLHRACINGQIKMAKYLV